MSLIDKIRPWAETGTKTKPADVKIDAGWIGGEQPEHEYENERQNTRDTKLNQLVDNSNRGTARADKLFNNVPGGSIKDIAFPWSPGNTIDVGNGFGRGACLYDHAGTKLVMVVHQPNPSANWHLYGINVDTNTVDVDLDVSTDLGLSGHRIWALACDGQWIYLMGEESDASYRRYQVYAKDIYGVDKPGFGYNECGQIEDIYKDERTILKVLESGNLFVAGRWDALGEKKCHIIDATTGNIVRSGDVDMLAAVIPSGDCVECGGHIFFTTLEKTADVNGVCVVDESDLTIAAAGTSGFYAIGDSAISNWFVSLATLGDLLVVAGRLTANNWPYFAFFDGATFPTPYLSNLQWANDGSINGPMFFDGHNLWALIYNFDTTPEMLAIKIRPQSVTNNMATTNLVDMVNMGDVILLDPSNVDVNVGYLRPPIVFDGASIWVSSYLLKGGGVWSRIVDALNN